MIIKIGKKYLLDYPNKRKIHSEPKPRCGGIAIYITFMALALLMGLDPKLLIPLSFIFLVGLVDDLVNIPAVIKLIFQIITGVITVHFLGVNITSIQMMGLEIELGITSKVFTVLWFVGIMNAFNLIDGLDGLSSGNIIISSTLMLLLAIMTSNYLVLSILVLVIGAILGFLPYNLPPSKAFLGDAGTLSLGYLMAFASGQLIINAPYGLNFVGILLVLFVPIFDTSWAIIRRFKGKKPIFKADKGHIHHVLFEIFNSDKTTLIVILSWGAFVGFLGLLSIITANTVQNLFLLTSTFASSVIVYNLSKLKEILIYSVIVLVQSPKHLSNNSKS